MAAIAARVERAIEHASESSARDVLAAQQEARALIGLMLFPFLGSTQHLCHEPPLGGTGLPGGGTEQEIRPVPS